MPMVKARMSSAIKESTMNVLKVLSAAAVMALACAAQAQVQQLQAGQALDANPQVGSGGYNTVNGGYGGVNSQLYVSGQVTGLGAFRGRTAQGALEQFSSGLPSAGFDSFRNQSVGMQNAINQPAYQPGYAAPSALPPTLQNLSGGGAGGVYSRRADAGMNGIYSDATADYQSLLANAPLRTYTPQGDTALPQMGGRASGSARYGGPLFGLQSQARDDLVRQLQQMARKPNQGPDDNAEAPSPSDTDPMWQRGGDTGTGPQPGGTPWAKPEDRGGAKATSGYQMEGVMSPKANQDIFVDLLVNLQARRTMAPGKGEGDQPKFRPGQDNTVAGAIKQIEPGKYVVEISADRTVVLHSFAGSSGDLLNAELRKAQKKLKEGKYYDAAADFETACIMDTGNPVPRLGAGLALFAAGESFSAALQFQRAMQAFPPTMEARLDIGNVVSRETFDKQYGALCRRIEQDDERAELGLVFLATFVSYADHQDEQAKIYAQRLKDLASDDKLLTSYAEFILTGKRPAGQAAAPKAAPK